MDNNINYDDIRPLTERTIGCLYYTSYNEEHIKYLNDDNHLTSNQNNTSQVKLPKKNIILIILIMTQIKIVIIRKIIR